MKKLGLLTLGLVAVLGLASCTKEEEKEETKSEEKSSGSSVQIDVELDETTKKCAVLSIGGAGVDTLIGYFEDEFDMGVKTDDTKVVAGSSIYNIGTGSDYSKLTSDYVVFAAVEFTGKGGITIGPETTKAEDLVAAKATAGFKLVLCGVDGAKNRGTSTDGLWDTLLASADEVIVGKDVVNEDGKFVTTSTYTLTEVEGTATNYYNGCVNAVGNAYNRLVK